MNEPKFQLRHVPGFTVSDDELLSDLRRVDASVETETLSARAYGQFGNFSHTTVQKRFGSWNTALAVAGLRVANEFNIPEEQLFENLMRLWEHYGRQPRRRELSLPPSRITISPYVRRFQSWRKAFEKFVEYANAVDIGPSDITEIVAERRTARDPSLRMRFRVMQRDNFSCRACGASPASSPGIVLHIDHIKPWSRGGQTVEQNLQTLCEQCNLGKGNLL
jgi:hypothetical protein